MMRWICLVLPSLLCVMACGGPSQFAASTLYDARAQFATVQQSEARQLAPAVLEEAQHFLEQAEIAFEEGDNDAVLRLSHHTELAVQHARLLAAQRRAERNAQIAEIDLAEAQNKEALALQERLAAEQELSQHLEE